jgi:hypothetical protein
MALIPFLLDLPNLDRPILPVDQRVVGDLALSTLAWA